MRYSGAAYGIGAMAIVGSSAAVLANLTNYPTFGGQALRYAGGALVLLVFQRIRRLPHLRLSASELVRLGLLAATGLAGFNVCYVEALRHADPASVGTIIGGVPIVLAVLDPLLRRRSPSIRLVAAAVVVTAGVAIAQGFGRGSLVGLAWALGSLAAEVAFSLLAVPILPRLGPLRVSAYASALAVAVLLGAGLLTDGSGMLRVPTITQAVALIYLAVVVTAVAFVMWYGGVARLGADRVGLCAGVAPLSTVAATWLLGTGAPTGAEVAGALLVGAGVAAGLAPGRRDKLRRRAAAVPALPERVQCPTAGSPPQRPPLDTVPDYMGDGVAHRPQVMDPWAEPPRR